MKLWQYEELSIYSQTDPHLLVLYEVSNMYRTLASGFVLLLLLKGYSKLEIKYPIMQSWDSTILAALMILTFLFAYKKQTRYVTDRIQVDKKLDGNAGGGPADASPD
jgi:hypothetical protein